MPEGPPSDLGSTTDGLPVAPSLAPSLAQIAAPRQETTVDRRVVWLAVGAVVLGLAAGGVAWVLTELIGLITNLAFYGRLSTETVPPAGHSLGAWVVVVPVAGALVVGVMARFGSRAIRGHGIPEAMEQVLFNESRIPPRMVWLKPLSSAVSIGTGGPFGAEGPIIATGGALGSLVGQLVRVTADERKTLLAAGAAAGMSATFGSPVSAVLLAVELLLFEYRARSIIPVALASVAATAVRGAIDGTAPAFAMPAIAQPGASAVAFYILLGALMGLAARAVTRAVYAIEDLFERLPIHWMWWPALGGLAVGLAGLVAPRTMGVGYDNIEQILSGELAGTALLFLVVMKFISWSIALGSGTSGGTLAPLFTLGGGAGALLGGLALQLGWGVDPRVAALVGMAAVFAGASHAMLASVVFAFETTQQPMGLLPLLGGCAAAFLVATLSSRHSIMTEKLARRGARVLTDYAADYLSQVLVREAATAAVVTIPADASVGGALATVAQHAHQGFPVVDAAGTVVGVLTRKELGAGADPSAAVRALITRVPVVVFEDSSLREAVNQMALEEVGRLPVVTREAPHRVVGILTRSDVLAAQQQRLAQAHRRERHLTLAGLPGGPAGA